jgi:phosphatidate phosphatase PAH1
VKSLRWAQGGAFGIWLLLLAPACGSPSESPEQAAGGAAGAVGTGGTGAEGGTTATGGAAGTVACVPMPACDAALPDPGPARPWNHTVSELTAATSFANHRGYDLVLTPEMDQWVLGKFAYGVIDKDIKDEAVDLWLDRECSGSWELLGTSLTTNDGDHATVEGVDDTGGRVYFQIPAAQKLGIGRHRIWMVVAGDLTSALQYIEVVPQGTHYFVSDVDGTLTVNESEEYTAILTGTVPPANADSPEAFSALAAAGYRPIYLSARPEFLVGRTREFVAAHGFPLGLVRTTLGLGAVGAPATGFKIAQLDELRARGMMTDYGFGNTSTDADAYDGGDIQPVAQRIFFQYSDTAHGGRRIDAYSELLAEFSAHQSVCP